MSQRPAYRGRSLVIGRIQLLSVYWYRTITKHCANNASNDVNRPPLPTGGDDKNNVYYFKMIKKMCIISQGKLN